MTLVGIRIMGAPLGGLSPAIAATLLPKAATAVLLRETGPERKGLNQGYTERAIHSFGHLPTSTEHLFCAKLRFGCWKYEDEDTATSVYHLLLSFFLLLCPSVFSFCSFLLGSLRPARGLTAACSFVITTLSSTQP